MHYKQTIFAVPELIRLKKIVNMSNNMLHKASTRGHANHGWLDSHHSFSFAGYHDPERVHFGALRVLNDDIVTGGKGFGTHPHDNMEIISIPLYGALQHKDTTGRQEIIKTGDVQIMSAGSGISHSEVNASADDSVNFLQLWIFPKKRNIAPRYEQKTFDVVERVNQWQTVVSPHENEKSLWINQDAWLSLGNWKKGSAFNYTISMDGNGIYAFVIAGDVVMDGQSLSMRDGYGVWNKKTIAFTAEQDAEVLIIEVPMTF